MTLVQSTKTMQHLRFLPLLLFLQPFFAHAQSTWVKGYLVASQAPKYVLESSPNSIFIVSRAKSAIQWMAAVERRGKNGNLLELGLNVFGRQRSQYPVKVIVPPNFTLETIDAGATKSFGLDLSVEYSLLLFEGMAKGLNGYLGFALNSGYAQFELEPHQSSVFPANSQQYWGNLGLVPRMQLELGKRMKLDFNIALFLLDAYYNKDAVENPVLTVSQQRNASLDIAFGQKAWFRLGLGYRLGEGKADEKD
jgi:hypothetical protein